MKLISSTAIALCSAFALGQPIRNNADHSSPLSKRVIGGTNATDSRYLFSVSLASDHGTYHSYCGGAAISPNYILTAGHCVNREKGLYTEAKNITVGFGNTQRSLQKTVTASEVILYPGFDYDTGFGDIALIKVDSKEFAESVKPLPIYNKKLSMCDQAEIVGWGYTTNDMEDLPDVLQTTTQVVGRPESCQHLLPGYTTPNEDFVCFEIAFTPGRSMCYGDSGSPALATVDGKYYAIGPLSGGNGYIDPTDSRCALPDGLEFYTRASYFIDFISNSTGIPASSLVSY